MAFGWIKRLALPVLLLTLLAACTYGPNPRNYERTTAFAPGYGQGYGYGAGYGYGGCGVHPCATPKRCPPGYVLGRIPISQGGGRYCQPYNTYRRGCCEPPKPPLCLGQGSSCYGGGYPYARY